MHVEEKVSLSFASAQNERVTARYLGELQLLTSLTYKHIPLQHDIQHFSTLVFI